MTFDLKSYDNGFKNGKQHATLNIGYFIYHCSERILPKGVDREQLVINIEKEGFKKKSNI